MLPVFKLRFAYVERRTANLTELHIAVAHQEFTARKAHRRAAVAAAAGLMEHQFAVLRLQLFDKCQSRVAGQNLAGVELRFVHGLKSANGADATHFARVLKRSQARSGCSSPACSSCAGSDGASCCGFRGPHPTVCIRRMRHAPDKGDSSWSRRGPPESRAQSDKRG